MAINFIGGTGGEGASAISDEPDAHVGKKREERRVIGGLIDRVIESSRSERVRLPL